MLPQGWSWGAGCQGPGRASSGQTDGLMMFFSPPPPSAPAPHPWHRHPGTLRTQAHQGDFVCVECGKCFHQPSHLRAHMRAHTGTCLCTQGPRGAGFPAQLCFPWSVTSLDLAPSEVRGQASSSVIRLWSLPSSACA